MKRTNPILTVAVTAVVGASTPIMTHTAWAEEGTELVGTVWQWQEFQDSASGDETSDIRVPDPAKYTLMLGSDSAAHIGADCNRVTWTFTLEGNTLTFNTLGPSTLAACGEESLDQRFLDRLGRTATYMTADSKLYLNLEGDAGNLLFTAAP